MSEKSQTFGNQPTVGYNFLNLVFFFDVKFCQNSLFLTASACGKLSIRFKENAISLIRDNAQMCKLGPPLRRETMLML